MKKIIVSLLATTIVATPAIAATNTATMELIAHVTSSCQMVLGNSGAAEFNVIGGQINESSATTAFKNSLNVLCTSGTPYSITMTSRNAGRNANYNYALMNEQLANPAQSPIPYVVATTGYATSAGTATAWTAPGSVVSGGTVTPFYQGGTGSAGLWSALQPGSIILSDTGWASTNALTANGTDGYGGLQGYLEFPFTVSPVATGTGAKSGLSNTSLQAGTYSDTLIFNQVF